LSGFAIALSNSSAFGVLLAADRLARLPLHQFLDTRHAEGCRVPMWIIVLLAVLIPPPCPRLPAGSVGSPLLLWVARPGGVMNRSAASPVAVILAQAPCRSAS
jgi:hypothetical protein